MQWDETAETAAPGRRRSGLQVRGQRKLILIDAPPARARMKRISRLGERRCESDGERACLFLHMCLLRDLPSQFAEARLRIDA
jgi:hypothetical protein